VSSTTLSTSSAGPSRGLRVAGGAVAELRVVSFSRRT
jgi:hypothetical protein